MALTGAAAVRLYDDHVDAVHALIARRVGVSTSPAITADAFEYAIHTWERFDRERGHERLFLFGAAVTTLRRHSDIDSAHLLTRRPPRAVATDIDDPLVTRDRNAAPRVVAHSANDDLLRRDALSDDVDDPEVARIMHAVSTLPSDDRDVVLLALWEHCSQSEIAEVLELAVGDVRSSLGRIRRELKATSSDEGRMRKVSLTNVFDVVQSTRRHVAPMPLDRRRMTREDLFGKGVDDPTRNIGERSESGAVVSTAPHGTRAPIQQRPRRTGSLVKVAAGLIVVAGAAALVWSTVTQPDDETDSATTVDPTSSAAAPNSDPEPADTEFVRTGVSTTRPLLLPTTSLPLDQVSVDSPAPGSGAALLTAPDGTTTWIAELDGPPAPVDGLDVREAGAAAVGIDADRNESAPPSYRLLVPCGLVIVNDAPGQALYRPEFEALLAAMTVGGDGRIDILLPPGWSVLDIGDSVVSYTAQFRVPNPEAAAVVRLVQIPGGALAQLTFGGRQLAEASFLGGPAFVDGAPANPATVSVFWKDAGTAFNISSDQLDLAELEAFVETLEPARTDDWTEQFGLSESSSEPAAADTECSPQPSFGPTLDP